MNYEKGIYQDTKPPVFLPPPPPYPAMAYPPPNMPAPAKHVSQWTYAGGMPQNPGMAAPFDPSTAPYGAPAPRPSAGPRVFPPTINGYTAWKSCHTYCLGASKEKRPHAVKVHDSLFSSKQTVNLHAGAFAGPAPGHGERVRQGPQGPGVRGRGVGGFDTTVRFRGVKTSLPSEAARFEIDVGGARREAFEWRGSQGPEVKAVAAGCSFGWKLVRLEGGGAAVAAPAGRGYASGGKEVVAVVAHNASLSASKGLRFAFLGSGLAGMYGEVWEITAMASALKLWLKDLEHIASASG